MSSIYVERRFEQADNVSAIHNEDQQAASNTYVETVTPDSEQQSLIRRHLYLHKEAGAGGPTKGYNDHC